MSLQHSNADEVVAWLEAVVTGFDFTIPGIDQSLGRDIVNEIAMGIADRSEQGRGVDGIWLANSDNPPGKGYASRKYRDYGWDDTNYRTGQMLSLLSLKGRPVIEPQAILMVYGTGEPPTRSVAPTGYLSDEDAKITDYEKAQFANADNRDFYELDDEIVERVFKVAGDALNIYIEEADR